MAEANSNAGSSPTTAASESVHASEPTVSASDQAFTDSYKSFADELDQQTTTQTPQVEPSPALSAEDRNFVDGYKSFADEVDQPDKPAPAKTEKTAVKPKESIETLRAQLKQQETQRAKPQAAVKYDMPGPGGARVRQDVNAKNEAAIRATQAKTNAAEKEARRDAFMAQFEEASEKESEGPHESES